MSEDITDRVCAADKAMNEYRAARRPRGHTFLMSGTCQYKGDLIQALDELRERILAGGDDLHISIQSSAGWWAEYDKHPWLDISRRDGRIMLLSREDEL